MKKALILSGLLATLLAPLTLRAQGYYQPTPPTVTSPFDRYTTYQVTARYSAALPLGDFKNYIDRASVRGATVTGEWVFPNRFSAGAQVGYQYFEQRLPRQIYQISGSDVSAVQTRTFTTTPVMIIGKYHLANSSAALRPYVQVGAGGSLNNYTNYFGSLSDTKNGFAFAGNVAVGTRFMFGRQGNFGADVQVSYNYGSFNYDYMKNYSTVNASVGLVYRWW
ncbi:MAG: hypothetical protein LH606_16885 [Cytophagaceae bacterium]|nr:hypothetical protein [Cytophagaceae bacterium]